MARNVAFQILRGPTASMPLLEDGEFYFATDANQLYVGFGGINFRLGASMATTIQDPVIPAQQAHVNAGGSLAVSSQATDGISIGSIVGKTVTMKTGQLTTTAPTANQVVLSYTVTAGVTFYLEYLDLQARLTALSGTASILGTIQILIAGVPVYTATFVNPTTSAQGSEAVRISLSEPIPISAATVISVVVTPASATSMLWTVNFGGYQK